MTSDPSAVPPPGFAGESSRARSILFRFLRDLTYMPRWHKGVLVAALVAMVMGWGHLGYHAATATNSGSPAGVQEASPLDQPPPSAFAQWSRRAGTSVVFGFLVGWLFRAFRKIMASVAVVVLGAILLLSYFNFMNVDLTAAKTDYKDASRWASDQVGRMRAAAMGHIHSTLGGALGLFIGYRKKIPGV